jgi:hypothetical protein
MGSNDNSKPSAAEVLILDGNQHLVRQRQTFDDLIRGESIPKLDGTAYRIAGPLVDTNQLGFSAVSSSGKMPVRRMP